MQRDLGGQACLEVSEHMWAFPVQPEGMLALVVHGLDSLVYPGQPVPQPLGPRPRTVALRRADHGGPIALWPPQTAPGRGPPAPCNAGCGHRRSANKVSASR
jgi:hypothetical protein